MRILRMLTAALLAVTAVLYIGNGLFTRLSGREVGPVIECPEEMLEVSIHDGTQALLAGVTARDDQDGDLTDRVMVGGPFFDKLKPPLRFAEAVFCGFILFSALRWG